MTDEEGSGHRMEPSQVDALEGNSLLGQVLGDALEPLQVFHDKLTREGIERGIIGPRDQGIIWERHILNSAAIVPFVKDAMIDGLGPRIADIGSGGGFPGVVLAACMPECQVSLVEPMERRVVWLHEVIEEMELKNAIVLRKRAEEVLPRREKRTKTNRGGGRRAMERRRHHGRLAGSDSVSADQRVAGIDPRGVDANDDNHGEYTLRPYDMVTCRAVAPMTKLSGWTLPLLHSGGRLIALKGRSAQAEIDKASKEIKKNHGCNPRVCDAAVGPGLEDTHVVLVDKA